MGWTLVLGISNNLFDYPSHKTSKKHVGDSTEADGANYSDRGASVAQEFTSLYLRARWTSSDTRMPGPISGLPKYPIAQRPFPLLSVNGIDAIDDGRTQRDRRRGVSLLTFQ